MTQLLSADIAVVGAGFAGTLTGMILARQGRRVVLLERHRHPRFALGEASTPFANLVWLQLVQRYDLPQLAPLAKYGSWKQAYPALPTWPKRGFSFFRHQANQALRFSPDHAAELWVAASPDSARSDTHWYRPTFDQFLVHQAQTLGIPYFDGAEVAILERQPVWKLRVRRDAEQFEVRCLFLVDASGPGGFLSQQLCLDSATSCLQTRSWSLFNHFENVASWAGILAAAGFPLDAYPYPCDHCTLHHVLDGAWMWVIPFDNGLTSAGLMLDGDCWQPRSDLAPQDQWQAVLRRYPAVQQQFARAQAVLPWQRTERVQRLAGRFQGPDWAMLPHAAYALDALFSIGNGHTLLGIERLVRTLEEHWRRPTLGQRLAEQADILQQEIACNDALIRACYQSFRDFRLFATTSMFYFAGAHAAELHRLEPQARRSPDAGWFLSAQVPPFREAVLQAARRVAVVVGDSDVADYARWVREAIAPVNRGGFADPARNNVYPWEG
jgi:FADH2 O2-dependent halogenase